MSTAQLPTLIRKSDDSRRNCSILMIALVLMSVCPLRALAQDGHSHTQTSQQHELTPAAARPAERSSQDCPGIDRALQGCQRWPRRGISPFNSVA